jgi:hypothetical protein
VVRSQIHTPLLRLSHRDAERCTHLLRIFFINNRLADPYSLLRNTDSESQNAEFHRKILKFKLYKFFVLMRKRLKRQWAYFHIAPPPNVLSFAHSPDALNYFRRILRRVLDTENHLKFDVTM